MLMLLLMKTILFIRKKKSFQLNELFLFSQNSKITPNKLTKYGINVKFDGKPRTILDLLSLQGIKCKDLISIWPSLSNYPTSLLTQIEITAKYSGYLNRQKTDIERFRKDEMLIIPDNITYSEIGGISNEMKEILHNTKPRTLGAASRIKGITPGCLTALLSYVKFCKYNTHNVSRETWK